MAMANSIKRFTDKYVVSILLSKNSLEELAEAIDPTDKISTKMDLDDDLLRIESAMDKLIERKRERIELYLFSGMTQIEQANYFNTSQPNIKRDFRRALNSLVQLIE
jgi:RNA polymerase sigma factor (sigma-70 family)